MEDNNILKDNKLYLHIINNLQDGVYFVDKKRKIHFWNKAAEKITGYKASEIVGKECASSGLNHIDDIGRPLCQIGCPLFATNIDGKQRREMVFVRHKDGHRIPVVVNIFPIIEEGEILGSVEIFSQNSPKVYDDDLIESLTGKAMHDNLTKLPNRDYLDSFLAYKLIEYKKFGKKFAVLFLDIDNFRNFNNEYGHDVGDLVLINIAKTLTSTVRKTDLFGRWGGEEMLGIYSIEKSYDVPIIGEKARYLLENTMITTDDGKELSVTVSVGITEVRDGDDLDSIVKRADQYMYVSKQNGKNRITTDSMDSEI